MEVPVTGNFRFSLLRSSGWTRFGVAGAVAVFFATPMLWSIGLFGLDEQGIHRAVVFLFSGVWFFIALGYSIGWAVHGFVFRPKESEEDGERPSAAHAPPPPSSRPPPRPHG